MCTGKTGKTGDGLLGHDGAVSEVIGTVLLLMMVVAGTSILLLAGSYLITNARSSAEFNNVEQSFTMADSRLSKARFSTSIFQEAAFEVNDGTVEVNGSWDDSHIIVYNIDNCTELYNGTLGTVRCITDQGIVAYQGGGVWRADPAGGSIVISPPDFDYNGVTLTLPIMHIDGNASMGTSGNNKILICVNSSDPTVVFPKVGVGGNPIPYGHSVNITIKSDFYEAWASYINERTRAVAIVDPVKKTVNVSLRTGMPMQSGLVESGFTTKSMDTNYDAPIDRFNLHLVLRNSGNDYTITYGVSPPDKSAPDPDFQITISRTKGSGNKDWALVKCFYQDGTHKEIFENEIEFQRKSDELIDIDLLNHSILLNYSTDSSAQSVTWGNDPAVPDSGFMPEYDDPTYSDVVHENQKSLYDLIQHYMRLMAEYDQQHGDQWDGPLYDTIGKCKYDEGDSTFQLAYQSSQDIKYLYITEGVLDTSLASRS